MGLLTRERDLSLRKQRVGLLLEGAGEIVRHGLVVLVLVWGGSAALDGALSVGTLVAALQVTQTFSDAVFRMADVCLKAAAMRSYASRMDELLSARPESAPAPVHRSAPAHEDAILLDDVWFRYGPDSPWILKGFSLRVRAGEARRLTGPSGTGKSTLLRLIAGLYEPERGVVAVNGVPASAARRSIAYLPQDAYLFHGSILDNLRVLSGGAARPRLIEAAYVTGFKELVDTLPMGYETMLPPGGGNLSGGQRQLLLLTACIASERPILLLDESMAHLDRLTQTRLARSRMFAGKTLVTVEHESPLA
jgi:subfamily B ATP-binding cassette protein HlyB/CyaB